MIYYGQELYHHGIKGQKWGVRRYQNEDGTLTELGRRRVQSVDGFQTHDVPTLRSGHTARYYPQDYIKDYEKKYRTAPINRIRFETYDDPATIKTAKKYIEESDWMAETSMNSILDAYNESVSSDREWEDY